MKRTVLAITLLILFSLACSLTGAVTSTMEPAVETAAVPSSTPEVEAATPSGKPTLPAPPPTPTATYWVTNPTSGAQLFVQVILPNNFGKSPALVLVPGGNNASSSFLEPPKALRLADAGFVVVLFDPDGRGRSTGKEDFGGYIHQDGLAAVVRFTAGLPNVDAEHIGIVTYSYGITMGSGALARYPDLPVKFLIDWEGPANRFYTTRGCKSTGSGEGMIGWKPCSDDAYWQEREAVNFIGKIRVPYQRIQSEKDHMQPTNAHAVEMVNAAVKGGVPWVRLNYYPPNQMYDPKAPPVMFPEQQDRMLEQTIANCAKELLKNSTATFTNTSSPTAAPTMLPESQSRSLPQLTLKYLEAMFALP